MLDKWLKKWTLLHDIIFIVIASSLIVLGLLAITTLPEKEKGFVGGLKSHQMEATLIGHWQSRHGKKSYTVVTPNRYLFKDDGSNRRQSRTDTHNRKFLESMRKREPSLSQLCSTDTLRDGIARLDKLCDSR